MKGYVFIIGLLFSFSSIANTYFVSKQGNDANSGTEILPWLTIQKAADVLTAGDTVFIKEGTYNERVEAQFSGAISNEIVYVNFQNDAVTLDGSGINLGGWNGLFDVSYQSYIKVMGLYIQNSTFAGFFAENSSYIDIRNNKTYNTFSSGIGVWNSSYVSVWNNEVELACNDGGEECITIATSNNCDIYYNEVHHNGLGTEGGEGIDAKQGSFSVQIVGNTVHHLNGRLGIYVDAWDAHTYDILVAKNRVHHCKETGMALASESGGLLENVIIENNILHHNKYGGIEIGSWSDIGFTGPMPIKHIKIINNTCYQNGSYDGGWGFGIAIDNPNAEDVVVRNNICSQNSAQIAVENILSGGVIDHNLIDGLNSLSECVSGSDFVVGDPQFWDVANTNFNLKSTSPAIDQGATQDAPATDYNNYARPQGTTIDIGALEYNVSAGLNGSVDNDFELELYPNPTSGKFTLRFDDSRIKFYDVRIVTVHGDLVKFIQMEPGNNLINVQSLATGVYFVEVLDLKSGLKSVQKLILHPS